MHCPTHNLILRCEHCGAAYGGGTIRQRWLGSRGELRQRWLDRELFLDDKVRVSEAGRVAFPEMSGEASSRKWSTCEVLREVSMVGTTASIST